MLNGIEEVEFTIFDTETTGLDFMAGDRIVELAAVRFKGKKDISYFDSLINPGRFVSIEAYNVNKISVEMVLSAPYPKEIIPKFMDFIRGSCLCSYNASFDLGFLNNELRILGLGEVKGIPIVDILKLARSTIPGLGSYALWSVAKNLGVSGDQKHRALSDVLITQKVFHALKEVLTKKNGLPLTLEKIINI